MTIRQRLISVLGGMGAYRVASLLTADRPRILVYHRFNQRECDPAAFRTQMQILKRDFNVVPMAALYRALRDGSEIARRTVAITIDDGYADFRQHAFSVLRELGLPALIYVVSDFVDRKCWLWPDIVEYIIDHTPLQRCSLELDGQERVFRLEGRAGRRQAWNDIADLCLTLRDRDKRAFVSDLARVLDVSVPDEPTPEYAALSWDELREMQQEGVEVGSHTCTHPKLTLVDDDQLRRELRVSKNRIEEMLDRTVEGFCYPNGSRSDVDEHVKRAVRSAGYMHATVGFHDRHIMTDLYEIRRYGVDSDMANFRSVVYGVECLRDVWGDRGLP